MLLLRPLFAQDTTPLIRARVRLVSVPTLVFSEQDRLISGLSARDFHIFDNGEPQEFNLDDVEPPLSLAIAVQSTQDVRAYLPFIARAGSLIEALLVGQLGKAAVISYSDEVTVLKPFEGGSLQSGMEKLPATGRKSLMLDAASRGLTILNGSSTGRSRFLILIGQSMDNGSSSTLAAVREAAEAGNVVVFAIALPEYGKSFVSDNFSLAGPSDSSERGGFKAGVNLGRLLSVVSRTSAETAGADPFSVLTAATGGAQFHVRKQKEFEEAISAIGLEARSAYQLSYSPASNQTGYHSIRVEVDIPKSKVLSRPGYWRPGE